MAAYGALVSLFNDLELIPNHPTHSFSFDHEQISSLFQIVEFLIDFMETYDSHGFTREAAEVLESEIASAAHAAHDVIESHVVDQIHAGSSTRGRDQIRAESPTRGGEVKSYFLRYLQRAIDNIKFVKRKAMQYKAKSGLKAKQPTYSTPSTSSLSLKDDIAGFDSLGFTGEAAGVLESEIASAVDDVIESHVVDQIRAESSTRSGEDKSYFLQDLQRVIDDMEFVKRKAMQLKAKSGLKAKQPTYSAPSTSSLSLKDDLVGFDEVVGRLVEKLTREPSRQRLVIPIAGMGGLGKTSLVKTVYHHSYSVEYHFKVRLWATISQQYSAENILRELLDEKTKSTTGGNVGELGVELHQKLYNRRYLIVLDDMWSEGAWDVVQKYLPDNGNGSRVIVTTRLSNLAARLNSTRFELNFLDADKSWELFCRKTFGEEDCPVELENIGKKIVQRCRGLPLSIVVVGGHLRKFSRAIEHWEKVADLMNPISSVGGEEQCLEILSLSYQHLPIYLKPCFLYLGVFREDEFIITSELISLWIAEGFIKAKKGLSLEEIGEEYLTDLINTNLILVDRIKWNGKVERCKIHDSVREVCLKVCKKEKFLRVVGVFETSCKVRRLVIPKRAKLILEMIGGKQSAPLLRSLVHQGRYNHFLKELPGDCRLIRVVHNWVDWEETCSPLTHFQQVNLRTAKLANISKLSLLHACWNLQSLSILCFNDLPFEIWEMPQLRNLYYCPSICLSDPVVVEGSKQEECIVLQNLYTLEGVVNLRLTEEVCKRMPNLNYLRVRYEQVRDDYCFHNLSRFNKLKRLVIHFDVDSKWCNVVVGLTFPASLEELSLENGELKWEDLTMMLTSLPHLGSLRLFMVRGSKWNLEEKEFRCLKRLEIDDCEDLKYLNANSSHFPVLESLHLIKLPRLNEIPLDIGEIQTLQRIQLEGCRASIAFSAMRMVIERDTNGSGDLQLYVEFWTNNEFERFQKMMQKEGVNSNNLHLSFSYRYKKSTICDRLLCIFRLPCLLCGAICSMCCDKFDEA